MNLTVNERLDVPKVAGSFSQLVVIVTSPREAYKDSRLILKCCTFKGTREEIREKHKHRQNAGGIYTISSLISEPFS